MYTIVQLSDGVLKAKLEGIDDEDVNAEKWRDALHPAISFLRSLEGGECLVSHALSDLTD